MSRLVTAVFYERSEAQRAVDALRTQGIPIDQIYLEEEIDASGEMGRKGGAVGQLEAERRFAGLQSGSIIGGAIGAIAGMVTGMLCSALAPMMAEHPMGVQGAGAVIQALANVWLSIGAGTLIGLLAGALFGWTVDTTLNSMGAGPPMPACETLVTVRTEEPMLDRVYRTLFDSRARHLHVSEATTA